MPGYAQEIIIIITIMLTISMRINCERPAHCTGLFIRGYLKATAVSSCTSVVGLSCLCMMLSVPVDVFMISHFFFR